MYGIAGLGGVAPGRPRPARGGAGGFRVADGPAAAGAPSAAAPAGLSGLLAMQEAEAGFVRDREARRHGDAVMAELAALQRELLGGEGGGGALTRLATLARHAPGAADPRLGAILRAVLVRAQVELARRDVLRHPGDTQNLSATSA